MDSEFSLSDVLHGNWLLEQESEIIAEDVHSNAQIEKKVESNNLECDEPQFDEQMIVEEVVDGREHKDREPSVAPEVKKMESQEKPEVMNAQFSRIKEEPKDDATMVRQMYFHPGYADPGFPPVPSTYHQPFIPMSRKKKKPSALKKVLQSPMQTFLPTYSYLPTFQFNGSGSSAEPNDKNNNCCAPPGKKVEAGFVPDCCSMSIERKDPPFRFVTPECCAQSSKFLQNHPNRSFDHSGMALDEMNDDNAHEENAEKCQDGEPSLIDDIVGNIEDADNFAADGAESAGLEEEEGEEGQDEKLITEDDGKYHGGRGDGETNAGDGGADGRNVRDTMNTSSTASATKAPRSELEALLMKPVKKPTGQEYPQFVLFSALGSSTPGVQQQSAKTMQFYQPPSQHLSRNTPPPGFAQPYGMGMRPHEEETRQIMNLDNQQTHSSSPTSSWNQPYPQMTNLNAYQQRAPGLYAPPNGMVHQNGPVVPTSNPYYQGPGQTHHHMQPPQAPMMPPGMQQQPYYNTQSPLTGTPPSMSYGTPGMPAPQATNGTGPIFNFSKPRNSNEGSSNANGGAPRRKKHNDLSSPRYSSHGNEEVDASSFPDMSDFPLLDVVQSKAKKDAGRKPCRPHLCEQSRMLISRVCHFQREFIKRLPARHPLANSPFSKPDQWTSQIMGISLATVRKCVDMAVDEEVFTRCTDKNLVNLTPSERAEREELLSKLSTVFEDEKSLGAGTAGLTIAEYSPRRSYSTNLLRQNTDDKSSTSSYPMNGQDYGSAETTLLNLDDHSNSSKDFATPTPTMELSTNGSHVFEEIGAMRHEEDKDTLPKVGTPKRGRPRKAPGQASTSKQSKRKESIEDSEIAEDKEEHEKKTEDEDETNEESDKKTEEVQQAVIAEREDDAASSEGTNRSETATPEPTALASPKKTRSTRRKKRSNAEVDEDYSAATKKKRGSVTAATAGIVQDDENAEHKMVTRARSRQP